MMIKFDYFHKLSVRETPENFMPAFESFLVLVVEFITMPMAFRDLLRLVGFVGPVSFFTSQGYAPNRIAPPASFIFSCSSKDL